MPGCPHLPSQVYDAERLQRQNQSQRRNDDSCQDVAHSIFHSLPIRRRAGKERNPARRLVKEACQARTWQAHLRYLILT